MKLVDDWKEAHKWWSVRIPAIGAAVTALFIAAPNTVLYAWGMLPTELQAGLEDYKKGIALAAFGLAMLARVIDQQPKQKDGA